MKKNLFKLLALLFSGSLVLLFILYQTGGFDPVEVYDLSYPNKSKNNADSTLNNQTTEKSKSQSSKNQTTQSVPTNIELPKEQNVVIQFDGKYQEKEEERIRLMSSKSIVFPKEQPEEYLSVPYSKEHSEMIRMTSSKTIYIPQKKELENEGTPFNFYFKSLKDSSVIRNRAHSKLLFVDSNFQEEVEKKQRMSSSKSLIITKPVKPFTKKK